MVKGERKEKLAVQLNSPTHKIISDVPERLGGGDEGMDPHELTEAALAACTIMTCQMYADRKQWPLRNTQVTVKIESEGKEATQISRKILFEGDLSEEQIQRLYEIAEKCPIHKILKSQVTIESTLERVQASV